MADLENVIKEFETGIQDFSPADTSDERFKEVCNAVLALLKAQEPRVMTMEELSSLPIDTPVFIEENNDECGWNVFYGIDEEKDVCFCGFKASADYYSLEEYGESWRCWTSRPTDSERKNTPWE